MFLTKRWASCKGRQRTRPQTRTSTWNSPTIWRCPLSKSASKSGRSWTTCNSPSLRRTSRGCPGGPWPRGRRLRASLRRKSCRLRVNWGRWPCRRATGSRPPCTLVAHPPTTMTTRRANLGSSTRGRGVLLGMIRNRARRLLLVHLDIQWIIQKEIFLIRLAFYALKYIMDSILNLKSRIYMRLEKDASLIVF